MSIGGFGGSIGGFDGIYLLLLTIGVIAILFGFLLLALRKIITMLVLVGGLVIALVLTVVIQQFLGDVICSAGFFAGFMIYIAFATYAAKQIVLANVITLFALGLFMILFPLIFTSPYIFAILWFPLTFVLFYLAVKGMKRIGALFQQRASTGWTSRKEKPIPAGTFSDDSLSTGNEDDAEPDDPTVDSSVALTTPVDGPDQKDHSRTEARILGEKRMLLWIRDSFGIESPKVETCIEFGDCYIYKIMDEDMNLHEVTVDQAGNIINYCNPERLEEKTT